MSEIACWRGSSGNEYPYWLKPLGQKFNPVDGNYIFAKLNPTGAWDAVYVGQGDLATRADVDRHYKGGLIRAKGATHVHVRVNENLLERIVEWADILDCHPEALEPSGCNGNAMATHTELTA